MTITIGKLDEPDWEKYKKLRFEALELEPLAFGSTVVENNYSEEEWKRRLKNHIFAFANGEPVGMIAYLVNSRIKFKHVAEIFSVYLKKEFRGKGISKQLLHEVVNTLKSNGVTNKVRLTVNPEQISAVGLYKKFGFIKVGTLRNELFEFGKFHDEIIMELYF